MSLFSSRRGIILFFAAIMHLVHILHVVLVTRNRVDPDKKDAYTVSAYATQARAIHNRAHGLVYKNKGLCAANTDIKIGCSSSVLMNERLIDDDDVAIKAQDVTPCF